MTPTQHDLPIYEVEDAIGAALADTGALVLSAPTGSGKTTQVPQMLRRSGTLGDGTVLILQPRRLAARLVARRVAEELGTQLGQLVGFQTRHERARSEATRILFVTEGLFLRRLLADPQLTGISAVLLDEFHERSLATDLSLGLCRRLRQGPRPDLRLLVMSATLDTDTVAGFLQASAVRAEGRTFPVDVDYTPGPAAGAAEAPVWDRAAAAVRRWLDTQAPGDVLVFQPGAYEIRRTVEACSRMLRPTDGGVAVLPLHGGLRAAEQDRAVGPSPERKIIVATNVAETSITIDCIRCVVDTGLARVHRFDPARGVNALLVERISRAAADQRTGRAGRTAPGTCLRLWPRAEADARPLHDTPEVHRVDLAEAVLQLRIMGVEEPGTFDWLEPPPAERLAQATRVLVELGAVDTPGAGSGTLTADGRAMGELPAHPRLARLLVEAARRGVTRRAAVWAALIAERDICTRPVAVRYTHPPDDGLASDLIVRERALEQARQARFEPGACAGMGLHAAACREVDRAARQYADLCRPSRRQRAKPAGGADSPAGAAADAELARCLLLAYGDHLARRRGDDTRTCEMDGRRRVSLDAGSAIGDAALFVAVDVREVEASRADGGGVHTRLSLATAVEPDWVEALLPERLTPTTELIWDPDERAVVEETSLRLGELTLQRRRQAPGDTSAAAQMLVDRIVGGQLRLERWDDAVEAWMARARCVAEWFPERGLLAYDEDDVQLIIAEIVGRQHRWGAVRRAPCLDQVRHALSWRDQQFVEQMAPEKVKLPSGHGMRITYTPGAPPRGRARIQDFYGLTDTPRIAGGRVRLLLEILAPNHRPTQVTDDLAGFWERTYPELRQQLSRRYPKHEWR